MPLEWHGHRVSPKAARRVGPEVQTRHQFFGPWSVPGCFCVFFSCAMFSPLAADAWSAYPTWLNPGDNAWQLTAATLVGLMSVPGLVVLYGGVMQKRWSVNAMMMSFVAFALVLVVWVLFGFKMAFGEPMHIFRADGGSFLANMWGKPGP